MLRQVLDTVVAVLGRMRPLDPVANRLVQVVREATADERVHHALSGAWLGHPVHPMLTDVTVGAFTSSWVLDLVPGEWARRSADLFLGLGLLTALPTAAAGLHDWAHTPRADARRIGLVHAGANVAGIALYAWSFGKRLRGRRVGAVGLGWAGAAALTAGAFLGGHLTYRKGVGVTEDDDPAAGTAA